MKFVEVYSKNACLSTSIEVKRYNAPLIGADFY